MKLLSILGLLCFYFVLGLLINHGRVEGSHKIYPELQSLSTDKVLQVQRTGYHFQPPSHWINDPNGPMYFNGYYHLFYQYNPKGAVWGNIVWAHSVSKDLINWKALEPAIYPSKPFDINGCWSGSATVLPGNKPVIMYTGIDQQNRQVQDYAIPKNLSDPYLREWVKPNDNPVVVPSAGINATEFRDPTTAWRGRDGRWRILVGGIKKGTTTGVAFLYKSHDFKKWIKAKRPLHSMPHTGMWECPDFYPVSLKQQTGLDSSVLNGNVKHVLKVSLDLTRYEYYTVGKYLADKDQYLADDKSIDGWNGLRYDYGNFYASKTFFDAPKNRRILWGWANESDLPKLDVLKGWAGIQLIPRSIWLDKSGKQLVQWPIAELETLRGQKAQMNGLDIPSGKLFEVKGLTAAQADVDVSFLVPTLDRAEVFNSSWAKFDAQHICGERGSKVAGGIGPFGLLTLASKNLEEYTPVFFRVFKTNDKNKHRVLLCSDARSSSLAPNLYKPSYASFVDMDLASGEFSLRSLIDHSVVESFGAGGKTCITSRVYPTLAAGDAAHLFVFNNGTTPITVNALTAWSMKRPLFIN